MMLRADVVDVRRNGNDLLKAVSMPVAPRRLSMLLGPNGAGKSTLLRVLAGTLAPDAGSVSLDGRALRHWSPQTLAMRRAVVPQSLEIAFRFTAWEVVQLGVQPGAHPGRRGGQVALAEHAITQAMQLADCLHLARRVYPELSGGEKSRVQMARALMQLRLPGEEADTRQAAAQRADVAGTDLPEQAGTRYLLLDEPAASLDPGHQHALLGLLRALVARFDLGVMVIMHDLNLASQYADDVWLLQAGHLFDQGPARELVRDRHIRPLFGVNLQTTTGAGQACGQTHAVATTPLRAPPT